MARRLCPPNPHEHASVTPHSPERSGTESGSGVLEQTPHNIGVYEFRYRGPQQIEVGPRLDRRLEVARAFLGASRP